MLAINEKHNSPIRLYLMEQFPQAHPVRSLDPFEITVVTDPESVSGHQPGILFLSEGQNALKWKPPAGERILVIGEEEVEHADFLVPKGWPSKFTLKALEAALRELQLQMSKNLLLEELASEHQKLFELTEIGLALSAERDLNRLLTKILAEGRNWGCCDAAALFLVERTESGQAELVFKLTQNDSISCPFEERRFPLDKKSIAGFVAVTGEILNIDDVYQIDPGKPYHFNHSFDQSIGYHTRSMLTIPMKNHEQEIIGVLQFINRKTTPDIHLTSKAITESNTLPFSEDIAFLLQALASQAAVAIGNTRLIDRIHLLFEGFVQAAVTAIEQRDPTTSGHSFRVAELTTGLAVAVPRSGISIFRDVSFNETQIKEIRYASLLHDFGKVGVREPVLVKSKKLPPRGLELIWYRFELFKEQLRRRHAEQKMDHLKKEGWQSLDRLTPSLERALDLELERFSNFYQEIASANEPTIMPEGRFNHLQSIRELEAFSAGNRKLAFLEDDEFLALSVRRGNLTAGERKEIESHVVHTFNFLQQIPWTNDLRNIPEFALAHHEKLDGSGYPDGKTGDNIPLPSKMMAIADIYDALTASDRPYKKALPPERALDILTQESGAGLIDPDLVNIFIEANVYSTTKHQMPHPAGDETESFQRNVCDYDALSHLGK